MKLVKENLEIDHNTKEDLAADEHDRWSRWMKYLFKNGKKNEDGTFTIDADKVKRWERQMNTPYDKLSKDEKDSDRKEADQTIKVLKKNDS